MADGSIGTPEQSRSDQLDAASLCLSKAAALSDVLEIMSCTDEAESLHERSLSTTLSMLHEIITQAQDLLHAGMGAGLVPKAAQAT